MVTIHNLSKQYAKSATKAVDGLTLDLRPGELFGFIGPNGAGKTTTIKMLIGITPPDSGTIAIDGVDLAAHPIDAKRKIGYVPDTYDLFDRLTGEEYLHFVADVYGVPMPERQTRMARYLHLFELTDVIGNYLRSYSHGMRQKLLVIGSLLHQPLLWVLDEPLTGLDPLSTKKLKDEMRAQCDAGHTVFFSSHVLDVVEKICDRVGIIHQGKLLAVGSLDELRTQAPNASLEQLFMALTAPQEG